MTETPFQLAACKAFDAVLDELENFGLVRPFSVTARREALRSFKEKIASQADAFRACVSADELEQALNLSRAEAAFEMFVRVFKQTRDMAVAREAFFAAINPPAPKRIP